MKSKELKRLEAKQYSIKMLAFWQSAESEKVAEEMVELSNRDMAKRLNGETFATLCKRKIAHHQATIQTLSN